MPDSIKQQARLKPEQLRWNCSLGLLPFETTAEVDPAQGVIGQPTAKEALKFGLQCLARGQNVYVRGSRGTGRIDMVHQLLAELHPQTDDKRDFCYVHNFVRPDHPRLITLPPGKAPGFRYEVLKLVEFYENDLDKALESEPHLSRRQAVQEQVQSQMKAISGPLEADIEADGMTLVSMPPGPSSQTMIFPVVEGQPVPPEQLRLMVNQGTVPEEKLAAYEQALPQYQKRLQETGREVSELLRAGSQQIQELTASVIRSLSADLVKPIVKKYRNDGVKEFLSDVVDDVMKRKLSGPASETDGNFKQRYDVNVVLTHEDRTSRPIVEENTPSLINLLGTVEPKWGPGGVA